MGRTDDASRRISPGGVFYWPAWEKALFGSILAFAAWARLSPLLGGKWIHIDDLLQYYAVTRPTLRECWQALSGIGPLQAPLDYLIDFAAARFLTGLDALSLLPAAWGIGAVAAVYLCGRRLHGPALAAPWALLLAVSIPHISYSQTLRPYALAVLLSALALNFYLQALEGRRLRAYGAVMALFQLAFVHAAFIGAAQLAWALLRRRNWRRIAVALTPSWLCLGLWFAVTGRPLAEGPVFHYKVALFNAFEYFAQMSRPLAALLLVSAVAALLRAWRAREDEPAPAAAFVLVAAAAAMFAAHAALQVVFHPRHVLVLLPYYYGLAAGGCALAAEGAGRAWGKEARVLASALFVFVALVGSLPVLVGHRGYEESLVRYFQGAAEGLRRQVGANEAIVFPNPNTGAALLHYLDPEAFQRLGPPRLINGFVFFGFPKDLTASVDSGVVPVHALCLGLPPAASLDAKGLARLRKQRRVWLAHMDSINYFHEPVSAFSSVGISAGALAEAFPGVYRLMPQR